MSNKGILSVLECYHDEAKRLQQLVNFQYSIVIYLGYGVTLFAAFIEFIELNGE